MLVLSTFLVGTTAGRDANAQDPAPIDPAKAQAQHGQAALGFDPTIAKASQAEHSFSQSEGAQLGLKPQDDGSALYVDPHLRFSALFRVDGTVLFADPWRRPDFKSERGVCCGRPLRFSPLGAQMSGPVEWMMYASDQEPLRREKAELLERTREFRTRLALAFARKNMAEALARLESELFDIWTDAELSEEGRRALLFARWDECDELFAHSAGRVPLEAISQIDRERVESADKGRREIESFIRQVAPKGSPSSYASTELEILNGQRLSDQSFDPYVIKKAPPKQSPTKADTKPLPNSSSGSSKPEPIAPADATPDPGPPKRV